MQGREQWSFLVWKTPSIPLHNPLRHSQGVRIHVFRVRIHAEPELPRFR